MEKAEELFTRFLNNECSKEEIEQLMEAFASGKDAAVFNEILRRQLETAADGQDYTAEIQAVYNRIEQHIHPPAKPTWVLWKQVAVAASLILVISIGPKKSAQLSVGRRKYYFI